LRCYILSSWYKYATISSAIISTISLSSSFLAFFLISFLKFSKYLSFISFIPSLKITCSQSLILSHQGYLFPTSPLLMALFRFLWWLYPTTHFNVPAPTPAWKQFLASVSIYLYLSLTFSFIASSSFSLASNSLTNILMFLSIILFFIIGAAIPTCVIL